MESCSATCMLRDDDVIFYDLLSFANLNLLGYFMTRCIIVGSCLALLEICLFVLIW